MAVRSNSTKMQANSGKPIYATFAWNGTSSRSQYSAMATNQCIASEGTEDQLICKAFKETKLRVLLFYLFSALTLGIILLVFYWRPAWKVHLRCVACDFESATHVIVVDRYKREHVRRIAWLRFSSSQPVHCTESAIELNKKQGANKLPDLSVKQSITLSDFDENEAKPMRFFEHKLQKYIWASETFLPLRGLDFGFTVEGLKSMDRGLTESEKDLRRTLFGVNSITVEITPLLTILIREIINPFYVFQIFSIVVWCVEQYFLLAAVILSLSVLSISISLYMTRKQNRMIHDMSSGSGMVKVLSGETFISRDSSELLPGDVIELQSTEDSLFCDLVLLSGSCVVSESMLTGESTPVLKTPLICSELDTQMDDCYDASRHRQHTLYGGTRVIDVPFSTKAGLPRALVIRTGFYTEKGKMIESMLSPAPMDYKFYSDSLRFILVMAILGVIGGIIAICLLSLQGASASHVVTRVLDLITIVVPPGLPAALTIATIFAQRRLKLSQIFCLSPPRINISGKINCMCFDKTGTLTENDLKLWGISPCSNDVLEERNIITDQDDPVLYDPVRECSMLPEYGEVGKECLHAMASCHSLINIDGKVVGDPIDLELFQSTHWMFTSSNASWSEDCTGILSPSDHSADESIGVVRIYQFNSVLQRMSVVVKRESRQHRMVYVKGAPETICTLCRENTVPRNFADKLQTFTKQGYRVLALASKNLEGGNAECMERSFVESDLGFLGLVILMNPLKPNTRETIISLQCANINTVMSTGDHLDTAVFIAKKCNMIAKAQAVVLVEAQPLQNAEGIKVTWTLGSSQETVKNPLIEKNTVSTDSNFYLQNELSPGYCLALSGETFSLLRVHSKSLFSRVLASGTVFARMKPEHKQQLVEDMQRMRYIVGMCGDGANDCRALKAAHVGIAIAEAETSIVAPFTSMRKDISCCVKVIREGRAALVTSFGMIKYLCTYSFVQYLTLLSLYTINSYMSDNQFLFADIGVTGAVTLFFGLAGASKILAEKPPKLSLVSPIMLTCLILQILLLILFQATAFVTLKHQSWYTPLVPNMTHPKENILGQENTVMFYTACFQYLTLAFIFYKGPPYRLPLYKNVLYFVALILLSAWILVMFFAAVPPISDWFSLVPIGNDVGFKFILLAFYTTHIMCALLVEKVLLESPTFERALMNIFQRCRMRCLKSKISDDESENLSYLSYEDLRKEMLLDSSWPPVNRETVIKNC